MNKRKPVRPVSTLAAERDARRENAKKLAREELRGIWAATLTPFRADLSVDEDGWRRNLRHWYGPLGIRGLFVNGKQGEFSSMTIA